MVEFNKLKETGGSINHADDDCRESKAALSTIAQSLERE
jgi:hypothetical protein